jgi:SulP family sulfate permease
LRATDAIARTATNIRNGATGPLAGMVHSVFLILVILLLASAIPLCCLSAILFVVAWNVSELPRVVRLLRGAPKVDVGILLLTFFLTVFVDLVVAPKSHESPTAVPMRNSQGLRRPFGRHQSLRVLL